MNCESARNRLLAVPDPAKVPQAVAAHLAECSACQAWHGLLVQVELAVAALPVPACPGQRLSQLVAQFRTAPAAKSQPLKVVRKTEPAKPEVLRPARPRLPLGDRLSKMWPAGLVAAAVLLGVISWAIFSGSKESPPIVAKAPAADPLLEQVVAAKFKLDTAPTTTARIDVLSNLAGTIHDQACAVAKVAPEEMASLASMYKQIVEEALVPQARDLNEDERKTILPIYKERIVKMEQAVNVLIDAGAPVGADRALRDMAEVARTARIDLAKLIQGRPL